MMSLHENMLRKTLQSDPQSRRWFLNVMGSVSALSVAAGELRAGGPARLSADPFTLGVASGDPDEKSVVLWTRLAPEPLQPGGGMPPEFVDVRCEIATDDAMRNVVQSRTIAATPQLGHSVHVEMEGLEPDRWYWYRFHCGDAESPVGRTRTMPRAEALPPHVRFAVTSCQNYEQGLFTAYEQMAKDDPDLVFHLGDYIYEYEAGRNGKVRTHLGKEIVGLDDYRIRYAQYRSDPALRHMHAQCPWMVTWDDHEFDNNCAGAVSEELDVDPVEYLVRRANAYQAYYEMMPLRPSQMPRNCDMELYRKVSFGRLADFLMLDTRQYRSDQPNNDRKSPLNDAALDTRQTMLGAEQKGWLYQNLIRSASCWNVLAQQVMMGMVNRSGDPEDLQYSMDQWPGYAYERMRLVEFLRDRHVSNPVVLTGDIHTNWANELRVDDRREDEPTVATEFVATSLTSGGNGVDRPGNWEAVVSTNPCVKFHNAERGYIRCEVTPQAWRSDYMVISDVLQPGGETTVRRSLVVESGKARIQEA
jgi:alkaline phosphatase D